MPQVNLPYNIQAGQPESAAPIMADFAAILAVLNGGVDADNVLSGAPVPQSSVGGISAGSSAALALADHQHILQGFERLSGDPTSGNFEGRVYYDTTNTRLRFCVSPTGVGSWITAANLQASDVPNHASRHATGGPDALPAQSIDQTMLTRPVVSGVPTADITVGATAWTDLVTGVTPTVTAVGSVGQLVTSHVQVGFTNTSGSNTPTVNFRLIDSASPPNVLGQTSTRQVGIAGSNNDGNIFGTTYTNVLAATPTLKLQVYASTTGITVKKTTTVASSPTSTGQATFLSCVVG